jgi:hypothetical protein
MTTITSALITITMATLMITDTRMSTTIPTDKCLSGSF